MITEIAHEKPLFICDKCNFITSNKKDYKRHILTPKHINNNNDNENSPKTPFYPCLCGKEYKYASGLSAHKKKCIDFMDSNLMIIYIGIGNTPKIKTMRHKNHIKLHIINS